MRPTAVTTLATAVLLCLSFAAGAQDFPSRRLTVVVPFPAGGLTDVMVRLYADRLSQRVGQPVIVENRPGGNTTIGALAVLQAPADGYTLFFTGAQGHIPEFQKSVPFDFLRDFQGMAQVATFPLGLLVNRQLGVKTMRELVDHLKANPGKLNSASVSPVLQVAHELFRQENGYQAVHITYRGQVEADRAINANEVQFMIGSLQAAYRENVADARVRVLAIGSRQRHPDWPELPTSAEAGFPNFSVGSVIGLFVSSKTPPALVQRLNQETNAVLALPEIQQRYRQASGATVETMSAPVFHQQVVELFQRWAAAVKAVGFKPE